MEREKTNNYIMGNTDDFQVIKANINSDKGTPACYVFFLPKNS